MKFKSILVALLFVLSLGCANAEEDSIIQFDGAEIAQVTFSAPAFRAPRVQRPRFTPVRPFARPRFRPARSARPTFSRVNFSGTRFTSPTTRIRNNFSQARFRSPVFRGGSLGR